MVRFSAWRRFGAAADGAGHVAGIVQAVFRVALGGGDSGMAEDAVEGYSIRGSSSGDLRCRRRKVIRLRGMLAT